MKILHQDTRTGEIKVQLDTLDDLWHLYNIVSPGDLVVAVTQRREEGKSDKLRSERGEKKRMRLGLRAEKVEFHEFDDRLRILGVIETGPQDLGSYHTFNLTGGDTVTVVKEAWPESQLKRLRRAVEESKRPRMLFVSLEYDEAVLVSMRQFGLQEVARIHASTSGKMYEEREEDGYYDEIVNKVLQTMEEGVPLVLLGPGFAKEHLLARGKEMAPEMFARAHVFHTGQAGMAGVKELMKRGIGSEVLEDYRVAQEMRLMERVLEEISKDGLVAYGPREVELAVQMGAVETLLVLDSLVRRKDLDQLMRLVEEAQGTVVVMSERHDAGQELESLGGMAALLRYAIG
ncbi:MAG: mRNA surveillance protein pelota [Methanomassiliicoccales archaeon]